MHEQIRIALEKSACLHQPCVHSLLSLNHTAGNKKVLAKQSTDLSKKYSVQCIKIQIYCTCICLSYIAQYSCRTPCIGKYN